jgi:NitT/TauT family transport system permease protein
MITWHKPRPAFGGSGRWLPTVLVLAVIVLVWHLAKASGVLPVSVPAPQAVWRALFDNWAELAYHTVATMKSALIGYVSAILVAVALAGFAVSWPGSERSLVTFGILVDSAPLIATAPILMIWFGNGLLLHVIVAASASLFPLLLGMIQGFKSADGTMQELFHVLGASRWQKLKCLMLPNALPYIFSALKIAAPLALLGSLIAEWMGTDRGLGTMIIYALFSFNVPLVWLSILAVSILTALSYGFIAFVESRILALWSPGGRTE